MDTQVPAVKESDLPATDVSDQKKDETQPNKTDSEVEKTPEKVEGKKDSFQSHPKFQQMHRTIREQKQTVSELTGLVKELIATQKGEEYKPDTDTKEVSPDVILEDEIVSLMESEDLDEDMVTEIQKIAKKYSFKVGDTKAYIPAEVAYQIFKDTATKPVDKPASTRPSAQAGEGAIKIKPDPNETWDQRVARLKRQAERFTG